MIEIKDCEAITGQSVLLPPGSKFLGRNASLHGLFVVLWGANLILQLEILGNPAGADLHLEPCARALLWRMFAHFLNCIGVFFAQQIPAAAVVLRKQRPWTGVLTNIFTPKSARFLALKVHQLGRPLQQSAESIIPSYPQAIRKLSQALASSRKLAELGRSGQRKQVLKTLFDSLGLSLLLSILRLPRAQACSHTFMARSGCHHWVATSHSQPVIHQSYIRVKREKRREREREREGKEREQPEKFTKVLRSVGKEAKECFPPFSSVFLIHVVDRKSILV